MKISQYLAKSLTQKGVTDVFGIPGGVILDIIYAIDAQEGINAHLCYHEQGAAYAACGYAQATGRLGVAYATKGPGIMNMVTAIADAYYDSLPVLFITAHSLNENNNQMRMEVGQEMNTVSIFSNFTKYVTRIDDINNACLEIEKACQIAMEGRKGPVLIDISTKIFKTELSAFETEERTFEKDSIITENIVKEIFDSINCSRRPVLLVGDGARGDNVSKMIESFSQINKIPILSSRVSQDVFADSSRYYGFIGSHGTRYGNFILDKADLIITLGNRLAYSPQSESFSNIARTKKIIRIDIDNTEFNRIIPGAINYNVDIEKILSLLFNMKIEYKECSNWIKICNIIKEVLWNCDVTYPVEMISNIICGFPKNGSVVCDVGNNELWLSRAYAFSKTSMRLIHSKSLKTVGCAIGKAIGAYYATKNPVLCIVGDQGIQFNIQELQYIANYKLPITIVLCNNRSSGMLRTNEEQDGYTHFLHTTFDSGYSNPNFEAICEAYKINYCRYANWTNKNNEIPLIIEIELEETVCVEQRLPKGNPCQKFIPEIDENLYNYIDKL